MPWTPLHAALGETTADMDFGLFERAVAQHTEETTNLDWKGEMPLTAPKSDQKKFHAERYKLAKAVAAMANSGGGMIVYGIAESEVQGRKGAGQLVGVPAVSEDDKKQIHQLAFSMVQPPVTGIELVEVHSVTEPGKGVLVMIVPDSQDAPHLIVEEGGRFQAPWRSGPDTFFMAERDLAEAYRRREQTRRGHEAELSDIFDRFAGSVGAHRGDEAPVWVVAVARPVRPLSNPRGGTVALAERLVAMAARNRWAEKSSFPSSELVTYGRRARRGLRLHYMSSERALDGRKISARAEVHGDGSLAVGVTRDGIVHRSDVLPGQVPVSDFEKVSLDLVSMLLEFRRLGGPTTDYEVQIGVTPSTEVFRRPDPSLTGHFEPFTEEDRIYDFRPVRGMLVASLGRQELLSSAVDVISDAVDQAGGWTRLNAEQLERDLIVQQVTQAGGLSQSQAEWI